jgi:hypothetical protein
MPAILPALPAREAESQVGKASQRRLSKQKREPQLPFVLAVGLVIPVSHGQSPATCGLLAQTNATKLEAT